MATNAEKTVFGDQGDKERKSGYWGNQNIFRNANMKSGAVQVHTFNSTLRVVSGCGEQRVTASQQPH